MRPLRDARGNLAVREGHGPRVDARGSPGRAAGREEPAPGGVVRPRQGRPALPREVPRREVPVRPRPRFRSRHDRVRLGADGHGAGAPLAEAAGPDGGLRRGAPSRRSGGGARRPGLPASAERAADGSLADLLRPRREPGGLAGRADHRLHVAARRHEPRLAQAARVRRRGGAHGGPRRVPALLAGRRLGPLPSRGGRRTRALGRRDARRRAEEARGRRPRRRLLARRDSNRLHPGPQRYDTLRPRRGGRGRRRREDRRPLREPLPVLPALLAGRTVHRGVRARRPVRRGLADDDRRLRRGLRRTDDPDEPRHRRRSARLLARVDGRRERVDLRGESVGRLPRRGAFRGAGGGRRCGEAPPVGARPRDRPRRRGTGGARPAHRLVPREPPRGAPGRRCGALADEGQQHRPAACLHAERGVGRVRLRQGGEHGPLVGFEGDGRGEAAHARPGGRLGSRPLARREEPPVQLAAQRELRGVASGRRRERPAPGLPRRRGCPESDPLARRRNGRLRLGEPAAAGSLEREDGRDRRAPPDDALSG